MIRFVVSAMVAVFILFWVFLFLSRAIGPGEPGVVAIIGDLGLFGNEAPAEEPVEPSPFGSMIRQPPVPGSERIPEAPRDEAPPRPTQEDR